MTGPIVRFAPVFPSVAHRRVATRRLVLVGAALALVFSACSRDAESYDGVRGVASALTNADLGCGDLHIGQGAELVTETASCTVDGDEVSIYIFATSGDRDKWSAVGPRLEPTVLGPNWAISGDEHTVQVIADELGGEVKSPGALSWLERVL
jgi:hypothetical protein